MSGTAERVIKPIISFFMSNSTVGTRPLGNTSHPGGTHGWFPLFLIDRPSERPLRVFN